jgi:hypothetical protein
MLCLLEHPSTTQHLDHVGQVAGPSPEIWSSDLKCKIDQKIRGNTSIFLDNIILIDNRINKYWKKELEI